MVDQTAPDQPTISSVDGLFMAPYITNNVFPPIVLTDVEWGSTVTYPGWTCVATPVAMDETVTCTPDLPLVE